MRYRDHTGLIWTRSEDGTRITADNGAVVIGRPEMTSEYLISLIYPEDSAFSVEALDTEQPVEKTGVIGTVFNFIKSLF